MTEHSGTPMVGPYSVHQMDDFYHALSRGQVKATGIMNYVQRMYIANRCSPAVKVVDVCCGRGLQLPVLYRYAPHIDLYVGLDIAPDNLAEARRKLCQLDQEYHERPFAIQLIECDVSEPWPEIGTYDVAVYTSALEHMPRDRGVLSLRQIAQALTTGGRLYLSTPNTPGEASDLQHRVHVYEWTMEELQPVLYDAGLAIEEMVGLLPPHFPDLTRELAQQFGDGAVRWYERLRAVVPEPFLEAIAAAAVPGVALEVLYVCSRRQQ